MDDRTTQIKEGAGLEESRLNTEFIEALQKWSSPILLVLAAIVGLYAGNNFLKQRQNTAVNEAFQNHADITETASPAPASLAAVAAEHRDIRAVGILAKLRHARLLLESVRTGGKPGAAFETDEDGQTIGVFVEADRMTDEDRERYLDQARGLFTEAIDLAGDTPGQQIHRINANFGLAAIAETRGETDAARSAYSDAIAAAQAARFDEYAALAEMRLASLDAGFPDVTLLSDADLPALPEPPTDTPDPDAPLGPVLPDGDDAEPSDEPAAETPAEPDETGGG